MRLLNIIKVLRIACGIILMIFGVLLMILMVMLPGIMMMILGTGLVVNQLLRCIRLLAVLAALLICYKFTGKHASPVANSLLWFSLAFVLMLYALFAVKIKQLFGQSLR